MLGVALGSLDRAEAAAIEEFRHDADAEHIADLIHKVLGRREREVFSSFGSSEVAGLALEGAGDDASDGVWRHKQAARNAAPVVELLDRHNALVARDLEHAVGARVDDREAGLHVELTEFLDDRRAARRLVGEGLGPDSSFEFSDERNREANGVSREGFGGVNAHHFPVASHGILAHTELAEAAVLDFESVESWG